MSILSTLLCDNKLLSIILSLSLSLTHTHTHSLRYILEKDPLHGCWMTLFTIFIKLEGFFIVIKRKQTNMKCCWNIVIFFNVGVIRGFLLYLFFWFAILQIHGTYRIHSWYHPHIFEMKLKRRPISHECWFAIQGRSYLVPSTIMSQSWAMWTESLCCIHWLWL